MERDTNISELLIFLMCPVFAHTVQMCTVLQLTPGNFLVYNVDLQNILDLLYYVSEGRVGKTKTKNNKKRLIEFCWYINVLNLTTQLYYVHFKLLMPN